MVRTKVVGAKRLDGLWHIALTNRTGEDVFHLKARILVNAAGPWTGEIIEQRARLKSKERVRLVRGSHIVIKKLYTHNKCYFLQGKDGRIVFAIPYENDFTLIGTTDVEHADPDIRPECSEEEKSYLIDFVNEYFKKTISVPEVIWSYSGVRSLYDDGASAAAITRDYVLSLDCQEDVPALCIFGGKVTTYRCLAEDALEKIRPFFPNLPGNWTAGVPLAGGDFDVNGLPGLVAQIKQRYPFIDQAWATRLARAYGTEVFTLLGNATTPDELGTGFGANLTAREVEWLMDNEFAQTAEDVVWRRSKLGLRLTGKQIETLDNWMRVRIDHAARQSDR